MHRVVFYFIGLIKFESITSIDSPTGNQQDHMITKLVFWYLSTEPSTELGGARSNFYGEVNYVDSSHVLSYGLIENNSLRVTIIRKIELERSLIEDNLKYTKC